MSPEQAEGKETDRRSDIYSLEAFEMARPKNLEAYEYYMKGMHFIKSKFVITYRKEDFEAGVDMFERAIAIDPNYALAYFGLAWAYEHYYHITQDKRDSELMQKNSEIAWRLDPNSALNIFYFNLINSPFYANLRGDSRFKKIIQQEKKLYEEYLEKYGSI